MEIRSNLWTEEEDNYIRENIHKITYREIAANIGRTLYSVIHRVSYLNLKSNRRWTEEEDRYIAENISSKSYIEIAIDLRRTYDAICSRACTLKLKSSRYKKWTKKEIDYLEKKFGKVSNAKIAAFLHRTIDSVTLRARRLGLGAKKDVDGMMTLHSLHRALYPHDSNVSHKLPKYIKNGLPHREYYLSSKRKKKKTILVDIDDFWEWAEQHKELVRFAHLEENSLGKEPKWVKEKRKQEWLEYSQKRWAGKV